jgi:hypothetical protein
MGLESEIKTTLAGIKATVDKANGEVARFGRTTEETGKKLDELDARFVALKKEYDAQLAEVSKTLAKAGRIGPSGEKFSSPGTIFSESESFRAMVDSKGRTCSPVRVGSLAKAALAMRRKFGTSDGDLAGFADILGTLRVNAPVAAPERAPVLRDLLTTETTSLGAIEYAEEVGFYHVSEEITSEAASGQATIALGAGNSRGFYAGQAVTAMNAAGSVSENGTVASVNHTTGVVTLDGNLSTTFAAGSRLTSRTFAPTPEGARKPKSRINTTMRTEAMKTIAHWIPLSRQVLDDVSVLRSHVDTRLLEGLMLSEEEQILYGAGGSDELQGIFTNPRCLAYAWSSGVEGDTKLDAIRRAMTRTSRSNYRADAVILNDTEWEQIETLKGSDGHYLWTKVEDGGVQRVWRATVVVSNAVKDGDALVGNFRLGAALYDKGEGEIRVSDSHEDYFVKNGLVVLAEERVALATFRPEAFCAVDFDEAPPEA